MQTNPEAFRGRGIVKLITEEGIGSLYKGWGWTMGRNAPGSFAVSDEGSVEIGLTANDISSWGFSCSEVLRWPRSTSSSCLITLKLLGVKVGLSAGVPVWRR